MFNLKAKKEKEEKRENPIKGGKGDDLTEKDVDPQELEWGIEIEKEHSPKNDIQKDISFDHLEEDDKYYTHLKEMEKKYEKKKAFNLRRHLTAKKEETWIQDAVPKSGQ